MPRETPRQSFQRRFNAFSKSDELKGKCATVDGAISGNFWVPVSPTEQHYFPSRALKRLERLERPSRQLLPLIFAFRNKSLGEGTGSDEPSHKATHFIIVFKY